MTTRPAINPEALRALVRRRARESPDGETRVLVRDVTWDDFEALVAAFESGGPRLTFVEGTVELMAPHFPHECWRDFFVSAVRVLLMELAIPAKARGSATYERADIDRAVEPDESYYLTNRDRLRGQTKPDLNVVPPPDLAIEVEITAPLLDKLDVYARLGFPEVWRFDGSTLTVLILQTDGSYRPSEQSRALPLLPLAEFRAQLAAFDPDEDETAWFLAFRDWVRRAVVSRQGQP